MNDQLSGKWTHLLLVSVSSSDFHTRHIVFVLFDDNSLKGDILDVSSVCWVKHPGRLLIDRA